MQLSIEQRLESLASQPRREITEGGMIGGLQVFHHVFCPTREDCIRKAAENLLEHRRCTEANAKHGKTYRGDYWTDRAAYWRKKAMQQVGEE